MGTPGQLRPLCRVTIEQLSSIDDCDDN